MSDNQLLSTRSMGKCQRDEKDQNAVQKSIIDLIRLKIIRFIFVSVFFYERF